MMIWVYLWFGRCGFVWLEVIGLVWVIGLCVGFAESVGLGWMFGSLVGLFVVNVVCMTLLQMFGLGWIGCMLGLF